MKSKILFIGFIILGFCVSITTLNAQSISLGQSNFPKTGDSISNATYNIPPAVLFTASDAAIASQKDSLSVEISITKALTSFGDTTNMKNIPNQRGYQNWTISIPSSVNPNLDDNYPIL